MEVLPFLYIGLIFVISPIGHTSVMGKWTFFWLSFILTPLVGFLLVAILPKRPKAVCMMPLKNFEIGLTYYYHIVKVYGGQKKVRIFNGYMEEISMVEFAECFSEIMQINEKKLSDLKQNQF